MPRMVAKLLQAVNTLSYASTVTIDASTGNYFEITLTGNVTFANPTNAVDGQEITIQVTQDATGSRIATWGTAFTGWQILSTAASAVDYVVARYRSAASAWDIRSLPVYVDQMYARPINAVSATMDPMNAQGSPGITTGRPYFCLTHVAQSVSISAMDCNIVAVSAAATVNHAFFGIYDAVAGTLLATTADFASALPASQGTEILKESFTSTISALPLGKPIYLCLMFAFSGTSPTLTVVGGRQFGTNESAATGTGRLFVNTDGTTWTSLASTVPSLTQTSSYSMPYLGAWH